jgi:Uma2 family endonuclease
MEAMNVNKRYTYADYEKWDDGKRWELIDGIPYAMAPAPSQGHQEVSRDLLFQLTAFLKGKPCKVFHAPFDVCLNAKSGKDKDVVQPDLLVVCDHAKLDGKRCNGAPDLIIEILSPSEPRRDRVIKFNKYLQAGVREYWIVDPDDKTVSVHILKDGQYVTAAYTDEESISVHILEGCVINLPDVFAEQIP